MVELEGEAEMVATELLAKRALQVCSTAKKVLGEAVVAETRARVGAEGTLGRGEMEPNSFTFLSPRALKS